MEVQSRTAKSIKNSIIALIYLLANLILQFYSRKVFLNYLGTEILGLNTTATNILQFLNIAELGIGAAVGFSLFKPLAFDDRNAINEIVALNGHLYRRIATVILGCALVVMAFFPWIFAKMDLPLWYAYASFGVLLVSALLGYYVNYRQIVLSSAQMDFKIQYATNTWMLLKVFLQIMAMLYLTHPYEWWLGLELVFAVISSVSLHIMTMRTFPYLGTATLPYSELRRKYSVIITKIKQLFIHKIGSFMLTQSSPLIIYAYGTLTEVTYYGNYIIIILGVNRVCNAAFNSIGAGVGNLVAEGDRNHILEVFRELFSVRFTFVAVIIFGLLLCTQPFICLWIGSDYLLPYSTLLIICTTLFINLSRNTVDLYINAFGLFQDVWSPLAEAGINIVLSIVLGWFYGLNGILSGVLISLIIIIQGWKPLFLFRDGMKMSLSIYWRDWLIHFFISLGVGGCIWLLVRNIPIDPASGWLTFIGYGLITTLLYAVALSVALIVVRAGIVRFFARFTNMLQR